MVDRKQLEKEIDFLMDTRREIFKIGYIIEERIKILKKRKDKLKKWDVKQEKKREEERNYLGE